MRRLLLLRHAKAAPATSRYDFERELTERGRRDAARVGAFMAAAGLVPALVLHSGAARTRQTAEAVLAAWPRAVETHIEPGLYEASRAALQAIVAALPDAGPSVMLIGHNPSVAENANAFAGGGDPNGRALMAAEFPTAGLAVIAFDVDRWRDVAAGKGALVCFATLNDPGLKAG